MSTNPTLIARPSTVAGPGKGNADRFKLEIEDKIWQYGPHMNPLVRIANKVKKRSVMQMEFKVLNDKRLPRFTRVNDNDGLNTSDTALVVDNGNYARPQDIWQNTRTKENILVTAVSSNTWTVVRGYDTGAAGTGVAMVDNDELMFISNALSERSNAPASIQTDPGTVTNYLQFMSRTIALSEIRDAISEYGPKEKDRQNKNTLWEFKVDAEYAFKFQKPLKDVEASSPLDSALQDSRFKTGGLLYWINEYAGTNALDANGVITQTELWDFLAPSFEDMPEDATGQGMELMALCSQKAFNAFHHWGMDPIQTDPKMKEFGLALTTYQTPNGKLNLVQDYTLKGDTYGNYMIVVNPSDLEYTYLNGKDMKVKPNIQANDAHEIKDEIYGVIGLGIKRPELHRYVYNMEAGA